MLGTGILLLVLSIIGIIILVNIAFRKLIDEVEELQFRLDAAEARISALLDR